MGLNFAIDELYSTGWDPSDPTGCERAPDGRVYPGVARIRRDFERAGWALAIRHVQLFDCFRAEWADEQGHARGAVVGQSEAEAAVYALAHRRRELAAAGAS